MSRRCDREGVAWDDRLRGYDRELLRAGVTCDALWEFFEWRITYGRGHESGHDGALMAHLRERPVLPPWWTQEMIDRAHALAAKWEKIFLDAEDEGSSDGATVAGERGSRG